MQVVGLIGWWLLMMSCGIIALPIVYKTFPDLIDRGYNFSKPLGLLLTGLLAWLIGFWSFSTATVLTATVLPGYRPLPDCRRF